MREIRLEMPEDDDSWYANLGGKGQRIPKNRGVTAREY